MEDKEMNLYEHVNELRKKFLIVLGFAVVIFVISFTYSKSMILKLIEWVGFSKENLVTLTPFESIQTSLSFSGALTLILITPLIFYTFYKFSEPAYPESKKKIKTYILGSFFIAILGILFGTFIFSKLVLTTLSNTYQLTTPMWSIKSFINFIVLSSASISLIMQSIVIIPALNDIKILNVNTLKKLRLPILLGMVIISALITPPDMISQILLIIPFYGSFELGMLFSNKSKGGKKE